MVDWLSSISCIKTDLIRGLIMTKENRLVFYGDVSDRELFQHLASENPQIVSVSIKRGFNAEEWIELSVQLVGSITVILAPIVSEWLKSRREQKNKPGNVVLVFRDDSEEVVLRSRDYVKLSADSLDLTTKDFTLRIEKLCMLQQSIKDAEN